MKSASPALIFGVLNEIGIIDQLASAAAERAMAKAGINLAQFTVLNHFLRLGDEKTPLELAKAFQVTKAAMTNTVQRLEEKKLVRVQSHPNDGRSKLVYITAAGKKAHAQALQELTPSMQVLEQALGPAVFKELIGPLQTLRQWLDNNRHTI
jgi:DNA-binding MarR family transcriptional regulator